jgi:hypothetical protein
MPLGGRDEVDGTVTVFFVAPLHKSADPLSRD